MARPLLILACFLLVACNEGSSTAKISRNPTSIRGWVLDVKDARRGETPEMEIARRTELFAGASIWIEETPYASGGISENGAFVVLDVPAEKATLAFQIEGAPEAQIVMEGVPGSAEVFIPDVILEPGGAKVLDPKKILVRLPADVSQPTATTRTAKVAGYTVPIIETPISQMQDRREYPNPGGFRPVATVK